MRNAISLIEGAASRSSGETMPGSSSELLLLREMHHRLMNSFALMGAYLRKEADAVSGTLPSKAVVNFSEMIIAQSELHRCLALGQFDELIRLDDYMIRLCRCLSDAVLRPFGLTCDVVADVGSLPAWQCERLGLATTELVLNAVKHAFCGRNGGKISVKLHRQGDKWRCVIADNGGCLGPSTTQRSATSLNTRSSLGSQIVDSLVRTLGGTKTTHATAAGMVVVMTFPGTLMVKG